MMEISNQRRLRPNCSRISPERASYNGSIEASQASDVGSIPIARSNFFLPLVTNLCDERLECCAYGRDLCADIGKGLRELEARFLSGEAWRGKISESLCWAAEFGGSELHVSPNRERRIAAALGRGDSCRFPVCSEGTPANYSHQAAARRGRGYGGLSGFARAAPQGKETWAGAISVAAKFQV